MRNKIIQFFNDSINLILSYEFLILDLIRLLNFIFNIFIYGLMIIKSSPNFYFYQSYLTNIIIQSLYLNCRLIYLFHLIFLIWIISFSYLNINVLLKIFIYILFHLIILLIYQLLFFFLLISSKKVFEFVRETIFNFRSLRSWNGRNLADHRILWIKIIIRLICIEYLLFLHDLFIWFVFLLLHFLFLCEIPEKLK